jgi:hypothetical protein
MTGEADAERARLKTTWPAEFADGERSAFLKRFDGKREMGGYPLGFHQWALERRNAWYCGYYYGLLQRQRDLAKLDAIDG